MDLHYVFFATVEVVCVALIVWSVWTRRSSETAAPRPVDYRAQPERLRAPAPVEQPHRADGASDVIEWERFSRR
jgi:hypothetical protein